MQSRDCMSSTARQPKKDNRDLIVRRPTREGELVTLQEVIHSLQRLLAELEPRLDSADNSRIPEMEDGLDFYAEVRRFEIARHSCRSTEVPLERNRPHRATRC